MSTPPITAAPDTRLWDAARRMYEARVGSILIVDSQGRLQGILTTTDILRLLATGQAARNPLLSEVMTINTITAHPEETLAQIQKRMQETGVRHIPIVDDDNKPLGMITQTDVLKIISRCINLNY